MQIFEYSEYKVYLRELIESRNMRGFHTKLASACRCKTSYLSQVLAKPDVHLTADHVMGAARFLEMSQGESEFFLNLLHIDRSASRELADFYRRKNDRILEENRSVRKRLNIELEEMSEEHGYLYYSSWIYSAIHILTTIPKYESAITIAKRLRISIDQCLDVLNKLQIMGLVEGRDSKWKPCNQTIYSSDQLSLIHHRNWLLYQASKMPQPTRDVFFYTDVVSMSRDDFTRIKSQLHGWIQKFRATVKQSDAEEIFLLQVGLNPP